MILDILAASLKKDKAFVLWYVGLPVVSFIYLYIGGRVFFIKELKVTHLAASSRLSLEMSFIPDEAIMAFASFTLVP